MKQVSYKSTIDNEQKLRISQYSSVVGLFRKCEEDKKNEMFLIIESINKEGKVVLSRYDFSQDLEKKDQYCVMLVQEITDSKNAKTVYELMINNESIMGKSWMVSTDKINKMQAYISQHMSGKFNQLGSSSTGPQLVKTGKAIYPLVKGSARVSVTGAATAFLGPTAAVTLVTAEEYLKSIPDTLHEPIRKTSFNLFGKACGNKATNIVESSLLNEGDNNYSWARKLLLSLDDQKITKDLPIKISDFLCSEVSQHLPALGKRF